MRTLLHVPIIHSDVDLGSLAARLKHDVVGRLGQDAWAARNAAVDTMWADLRTRLMALPLDWRRVRLFQDGLPVFGRERDIVEDLARQGSRNHQLLLQCMARGATLMGTEDPQLLVREYERVGALLAAQRNPMTAEQFQTLRDEGQALLDARDAYIARRIDATVAQDETAVLFIGLMHNVDRLLRGSFQVLDLVTSLPLSAEPERQIKEGRNGSQESEFRIDQPAGDRGNRP